jgi:hypothetical protein
MRRSPWLRGLTLLLAATLAATPALAARREPVRAPRQAFGVFVSLWQALEGFLPPLAKGVSTIDPDGAPAPTSKGVSTIDPNGALEPTNNGVQDPTG